MEDHILVESRGPVLELRINRPDKKNALTQAMYAALADALDGAATDDTVAVAIITGAGDIFTSGNDLKDFQETPPVGADQPVYRFIRAIAAFPKVLIAGVNGAAIGIGTTMLLHCDLVVASRLAMFHMPFVDLALVPEAGSSLLFPRLVGRQRAAKHLILAEPFDAETALDYGLVTELVDESDVVPRARQLAERVAAKPPEAVRITKQLIASPAASLEERIAAEGEHFAARLQSAEAPEAFRAFFEKRPPNFR